MDFIKKHKLTTFIIFVYIVIIGFLFFIYSMFVSSNGMPVYGDRLDGIDEVQITDEQYDKIVTDLNSEETVISVLDPKLGGKILSVIITVGDNVDIATAKSLANKVDNALTEEQKNFFDIEVFIKKDYNCVLEATGTIDDEGNFTGPVTVKFRNDLSKNGNINNYGISNNENIDYNNNQEYKITDDGTYIIYGFTQDKVGESKCSLKITKKTSEEVTSEETIKSLTNESFPIIGYKRKQTNDFVWTKDR